MIHVANIEINHARVKQICRQVGEDQFKTVTTYQACCMCEWSGPRRTREWEAKNDAANHKLHPEL